MAHAGSDNAEPPFSEAHLLPYCQDLEQFLRQHGHDPDWRIRDHQPMCLGILAAFQSIMQDRDTSLFPSLQEGGKTGFQHDIPISGVFPTQTSPNLVDNPLSVHLTNWPQRVVRSIRWKSNPFELLIRMFKYSSIRKKGRAFSAVVSKVLQCVHSHSNIPVCIFACVLKCKSG